MVTGESTRPKAGRSQVRVLPPPLAAGVAQHNSVSAPTTVVLVRAEAASFAVTTSKTSKGGARMSYLKRQSKRRTPQSAPIAGSSQVPNSTGGFAWAVDD